MSKVYKFLFLGVLMTLATAAFGQQVVFNENLGDVGQHKEANALLSPYADWENSAPVTFDHGGGGVFIDVATPSTGYTGASGNGYLVLQSPVATAPENVYHSLQIDGISTADLDSISLSFGFYSAAAADDDGENLEVYVSDGGAWTQLSTESTFPTFQTWGLVTFGANVIPATGTLSLKFVHNGTADVAFFIDDISLTRPTSMDASIWSFSLGDVDRAPAYMDSAAIDAEVVNGTALDNLVPVIKIHPDASITPAGAQDFSGGPVTYTVTAEDGSTAVD